MASSTVGSGESDPMLHECTAVPQHEGVEYGCLLSILLLKIKRRLVLCPTVEHQSQISSTELYG